VYTYIYIGNNHPNWTFRFFRGVGIPPTRKCSHHQPTAPSYHEVAVVGAGYIAVEMAGILHAMGSETHLFFRPSDGLPDGLPSGYVKIAIENGHL